MTHATDKPDQVLVDLDKPFATDDDRRRVQPKKLFTWKVVTAMTPNDDLTFEYRAKGFNIQEIVARYPNAIEIRRMKR